MVQHTNDKRMEQVHLHGRLEGIHDGGAVGARDVHRLSERRPGLQSLAHGIRQLLCYKPDEREPGSTVQLRRRLFHITDLATDAKTARQQHLICTRRTEAAPT